VPTSTGTCQVQKFWQIEYLTNSWNPVTHYLTLNGITGNGSMTQINVGNSASGH
jgi:hypothetical protein